MTTETRSTGEVLFDHPTSRPTPSAAPAAPPDGAVSSLLAAPDRSPAPPPAGEAPERPSDAEVLFGDPDRLAQSYAPNLRDSVSRLGDLSGADAETLAAHLRGAAAVFHEAGIEPGRAAILHERLVAGLAAPPDDAARATAEVDARRQLRARVGLEGAAAAIRDARAYVQARPDLVAWLDVAGVGNDPDFILAFAAAARRRPARRG